MTDYELQRLSSRSFEHLVQALSMKAFGPGLSVFGDGPDGQREATFDGPTPYRANGTKWAGYIVVQAKFRQRPQGTAKDGKWALDNLQKELDAWKVAQEQHDRRPPQYFLYVTNVVLSPKEGTGALDKAQALFEQYADDLGLFAWDIWHYDTIRTMLDLHASIRSAYSAFITSGDVLNAVSTAVLGLSPNFDECMASYLARELLADQYARLSQIGAVDVNHIPLANIFVDLPISSHGDSRQSSQVARYFVSEILDIARDPFNATALERKGANVGECSVQNTGRCVLVGGPGQGKTTVGQFLCQLFRAALLETRPAHELSSEIKLAIAEVRKQATEEHLQIPSVRRFPIRIVLTALADSLAKGRVSTLIQYIAATIQTQTGTGIEGGHVRAWLATYPWLLILDGLDEVPWSSNRSEVLEVIKHFWSEVSQLGADVLAVVTTRPQGYTEEFSPEFYEHMRLQPLVEPQNIHCAQRLILNQHSSNPTTAERLMDHVTQAVNSPSTARLMISPLQIHIMTVLIDRSGPPPEDRYTLFRDYYNVIYQRELGKLDLAASTLLREHRADIDVIHHQVGLLLQSRGAGTGETEARLTNHDFGMIVEQRLAIVGWEGDALSDLVNRIMTVALERLVLIVPVVKGFLGFEVRSLQEYMTAEALIAGSDENVKARLKEIATRAYWRNVFLLAVGKCRIDREHLVDSILAHLAMLNSGTTDPRGTLDKSA